MKNPLVAALGEGSPLSHRPRPGGQFPTDLGKMFNFYLSPALDLSRAWTRVGGIRSVKEKEEEEGERLPIRMFEYLCQDLGQVY